MTTYTDDLVLSLQRALDRFVRRLRHGGAPEASERRRFLIVQIDGLSRTVLEQALAEGRMPFLRRLLKRHGHRLTPMCVGLPTSTPAFQISAMYGVRPDIPGFHYHDKRRHADVYFPRRGDAAIVEEAHARGRRGILAQGSAYGCVFTGGALNNLFSFAMLKRPTGRGLLRVVSAFVVLLWVIIKCLTLTGLEIAPDFSAVRVESAVWVKTGPGRWVPSGARDATVRIADLLPGAGQEIARDPQVQAVFRVIKSLGVGAVPPGLREQGLQVGEATRQALETARAALRADLESLAFDLEPTAPTAPEGRPAAAGPPQ